MYQIGTEPNQFCQIFKIHMCTAAAASSSLKIQLRSITSDRTLTSLKRGPKKSWNPKSY